MLQITSKQPRISTSVFHGRRKRLTGIFGLIIGVDRHSGALLSSLVDRLRVYFLSLVYRTLINVNRLRKFKLSKKLYLRFTLCAYSGLRVRVTYTQLQGIGVVYNRLELGYRRFWVDACIVSQISGFIYPVDRSGWQEIIVRFFYVNAARISLVPLIKLRWYTRSTLMLYFSWSLV